jgi:glycine cleavage system H lipoate-binding protein
LAGIQTEISEIEVSMPAAIDVQGTVTEINPLLSTDPGVINSDPEGAGTYRVGWKKDESAKSSKEDLPFVQK